MTPALLLLLGSAQAQDAIDTIDIGVLKDTDVKVVQDVLYPKAKRSEMGVHLGAMPFDAFTTTPMGSITYGKHIDEVLGWEVNLSGGYSLKKTAYRELESDAYGVAPDAYRYLSSLIGGVEWSPVYAKMSWDGSRVLHHDFYLSGGAGLTVEQAMLPDNAMAFAPTLALGVGARIFVSDKGTVRVQLRDEFLREYRAKTTDTQGYFLKQNVSLTVGYTVLGTAAE